MNEQALAQLADSVAGIHLPRYRELPTVGLYLEQVTRYVNEALAELGGPELTRSMVSNYVKQKLIPAPVKKAYGPESLACLIFVACVKAVVPLEDIRHLIDAQKDHYASAAAYDCFCDEFENLLQEVYGGKSAAARTVPASSEERELLRTVLLALTHRIYLEHYLHLWLEGREA